MTSASHYHALMAAAKEADQLCVVEVYSPRCFACQVAKPAVDSLAAKYPDVMFMAIDGSALTVRSGCYGCARLHFDCMHPPMTLRRPCPLWLRRKRQ